MFYYIELKSPNISNLKRDFCTILNTEYKNPKVINLEILDYALNERTLSAIIEADSIIDESVKEVTPYWDGPCECSRNPCICPYSPKDL